MKGVAVSREKCLSGWCTVGLMEVAMTEAESDRHIFRSLFKLALLVGIIMAIAKMVAAKKDEYYGISESEARYKVESKLSPRVGDDRAAEIADQVVARLKVAGVVTADAVDNVVDKAEDAVDSVEEAVKDVTSD
jgi:hypothetical protein